MREISICSPALLGYHYPCGSDREDRSPASTPPEERNVVVEHREVGELVIKPPPQDTQTRSRLSIGEDGPSDSALAASRGGRLRRPAAERHAARCASREIA